MSAPNWENIFTSLIGGGIIAAAAQVGQAIFGRGKQKADATAIITAAAGDLVEDVRQQREADRREHDEQRKRDLARIAELETELGSLRTQRREDVARIRELEDELTLVRRRVRELERTNEEKDATITFLRSANGSGSGNNMRH